MTAIDFWPRPFKSGAGAMPLTNEFFDGQEKIGRSLKLGNVCAAGHDHKLGIGQALS